MVSNGEEESLQPNGYIPTHSPTCSWLALWRSPALCGWKRKICSITFPETETRLTSLARFFFPLSRVDVMTFPTYSEYAQLPWPFRDDRETVIVKFARSFSIVVCISSGPVLTIFPLSMLSQSYKLLEDPSKIQNKTKTIISVLELVTREIKKG